MVSKLIRLLFISLATMHTAAVAQEADIAVELHVFPFERFDNVPIGSLFFDDVEVGFLGVRITNFGPETEGGTYSINMTDQPDGSFGYPALRFLGLDRGRCGFDPALSPPPESPIGIIVTPPLLPGESELCVWAFIVAENAIGTSTNVEVDVFSLAGFTTDPDNSNNQATVTVMFDLPHPIPISSIAILILSLTLFLTAWFHQRTS